MTYQGERFVRVVGRRTAQIPASTVAALVTRAEQIRFFEMRDLYHTKNVTDLATQIVTITANGRTKRVQDYIGAPDALVQFEREIDEAAGTKRWIFLDEEALEELLQSGWDPKSNEGAKFLQEAIGRDEIAISRKLISLGADLGGPSENRWSPLSGAHSTAMVDLLVKAGADPNGRRGSTQTPLMATQHKDAAVARALLEAGARVDDDLETGRTALWYAACAGNWRVVRVLLEAGANPRGSKAISAAECTLTARKFLHLRMFPERGPTVEDFDKVLMLLEAAEQERQTKP